MFLVLNKMLIVTHAYMHGNQLKQVHNAVEDSRYVDAGIESDSISTLFICQKVNYLHI